MRARSLKPGFFANEILGGADPLYALLFAGLWALADREGRLEDRPLRICALIFPYRRKVTEQVVDKMLGWLDEHDFIRRYVVNGLRYIQVLEFTKHQRPHSKESPSKIPALRSTEHRPRSTPGAHLGSGEHALTPDSGLRTPDSPPPEGKNLRPSLPSTPEPVEGGGLPKGSRRNGSRANGTSPRQLGINPRALGTNPRALENLSLKAWKVLEPIVDTVKATASSPADKRLTWTYVRDRVDPLVWQAIEQIGGCAVIGNRDRFNTKEIRGRFRTAFERLVKIQRAQHPGEDAHAH